MQAKNFIYNFECKNIDNYKQYFNNQINKVTRIITNTIISLKCKKNQKIFSENDQNISVKVLNELFVNLMNMQSNINTLSFEDCNTIFKTTISKLSIILTTSEHCIWKILYISYGMVIAMLLVTNIKKERNI